MNNEEKITKRLNSVYTQSQKDINQKIKDLSFKIGELQVQYDWMDDTDPEKARVKSMIQSKIYQKQYQEQLKKQVDGILDQLKLKQYTNISDYLDECYTDGFIGTIFDLHGQGVPLMMPIDQQAMVRAVQLDSKISKGLYTHLGENVDMLKKHITAQVSRGISTGMTYAQVAKQISGKMMGTYENPGGSMAYSMRVARTEGHRIQTTAAMDAMESAKEKGADVVKQWDAALDSRTRESHQAVDGEIRELNEKFSNGLKYPGDPSGGAAEVVNCRCALLQRAKWALDDDELETLKKRAEHFGLDKTDSFDAFKKKYLKASEQFDIEVDLADLEKKNIVEKTVGAVKNGLTKSSKGAKIDLQFFASKEKQFGKKVGKHAIDFGLDPSKAEDREVFQGIINNIMNNSDEVRIGFWRGQSEDVLFHILGDDVVITDQNNEFISILKGGINNARVKNARNK